MLQVRYYNNALDFWRKEYICIIVVHLSNLYQEYHKWNPSVHVSPTHYMLGYFISFIFSLAAEVTKSNGRTRNSAKLIS